MEKTVGPCVFRQNAFTLSPASQLKQQFCNRQKTFFVTNFFFLNMKRTKIGIHKTTHELLMILFNMLVPYCESDEYFLA
jgi:hypothetical protein